MAIATTSRLLGEILVQEGLTTPDVVQRALARAQTSGELIGEALVALGRGDRRRRAARPRRCSKTCPTSRARNCRRRCRSSRTSRRSTCASARVCPISLEGSLLTVASADPLNPLIADELRQATGLNVKSRQPGRGHRRGDRPDLRRRGHAAAAHRRGHGATTPAPAATRTSTSCATWPSRRPSCGWSTCSSRTRSRREASDIHIEPFEDTLRVRYRIDGVLYEQEAPPRRLQAAVTSRIKIMAEMNIAERRLPQDGRIRIDARRPARGHPRLDHARPCTASRSSCGSCDRESVFHAAREARLPARRRCSASQRSSTRPHGILLVTGPTGSGKTTTLYAALNEINAPGEKIITTEDPVEYQLKGSTRSRSTAKIGLTFASGLRAHPAAGPRRDPGRRDPRPGDGRDRHPGLADRPPGLLHPAHQRRPRRHHPAAGHGRRAVPGRLGARGRAGPAAGAPDLRRLPGARRARPGPISTRSACRPPPGTVLYRGKGCEDCRGTGYRGRSGIYELFVIDEDARSLMLRRAATRDIRRHAIERGMVTLRMDAGSSAPARASPPSRRSFGSRRKTPDVMPVFTYRAADRRGQTIDGVMEAADARAVVERLRRKRTSRSRSRPRASAPTLVRRWAAAAPGPPARPPRAHPYAGTLFEAGLPLDRALAHPRGARPQRRGVSAIVTDLLQSVRGGSRSARRWPSITRGRSHGCTSTWCGPARRAACWRSRCGGLPSSWKRARRSTRRSSRPWPIRSSSPRSAPPPSCSS